MIAHKARIQEGKAHFQESLVEDIGRATKELLDAAEKLSWTDGLNLSSIDYCIKTTTAELSRVKAARCKREKVANN